MAFECPKCHQVSHHPKDEEHGFCGSCHDFTGPPRPPDKETGITFWVAGIVAARNLKPYVQLANGQRTIAQLTIAEARNVAFDILTQAHNAEADAMILKFFDKADFPRGAAAALMKDFRDFRAQLENEKVTRSYSDPDTGEGHARD